MNHMVRGPSALRASVFLSMVHSVIAGAASSVQDDTAIAAAGYDSA